MTVHSSQPGTDQDDSRSVVDIVKDGLTVKRARPMAENSEYAASAGRVVRAYSRRVAIGDVESLACLVGLSAEIDYAIQQAVNGLRTAGYSWSEIAARLGITRQAAQQRWGRPR
jgi:hypothetical protein